jgi:hypothetical protein
MVPAPMLVVHWGSCLEGVDWGGYPVLRCAQTRRGECVIRIPLSLSTQPGVETPGWVFGYVTEHTQKLT